MSVEAYTFGLIAVAVISVFIFRIKLPMIQWIWSIMSIGICAVEFDSIYIAFSPYLQLAVMLLNVALAYYAFRLYKGID